MNASSKYSPLASPSATKTVLERHGFNLKRSLGQNFLINDAVIGKILDLAKVEEDDTILEVGPGIGTLTYALLKCAKAVISIERDPALPPVLRDTLAETPHKFALIEKDALHANDKDLTMAIESVGEKCFPNKLVSNLPYSVAATIVLDYFERFDSIESMTVMVQREVAERMMAKPLTKNYGAYTVKLSMYAKFDGAFSVGPGNFMPPPHVESMVIRLNRKRDSEISNKLLRASCMMADAAFFARRKTIANSCKQFFAGRNADISGNVSLILEEAKIMPGIRGEALSPDSYIDLGRALLKLTDRDRGSFSK